MALTCSCCDNAANAPESNHDTSSRPCVDDWLLSEKATDSDIRTRAQFHETRDAISREYLDKTATPFPWPEKSLGWSLFCMIFVRWYTCPDGPYAGTRKVPNSAINLPTGNIPRTVFESGFADDLPFSMPSAPLQLSRRATPQQAPRPRYVLPTPEERIVRLRQLLAVAANFLTTAADVLSTFINDFAFELPD
ncbi:hypothetical protein CNMCM5793_005627 [Aspergillus hiratsukae]|uniref:Uncharacterized protein n=1 Tax=Aspergillus hiratsukae TaxID=1194566 RepID=A0A8H6UH18_9EURO|nr:hypothetical protein CNMCM5793_005627 [Aspergillus hiratsukae]KAF7171967.1 hypothetical protein CNMCM6106_006273 [Aspergillus hiratsukae]